MVRHTTNELFRNTRPRFEATLERNRMSEATGAISKVRAFFVIELAYEIMEEVCCGGAAGPFESISNTARTEVTIANIAALLK